MTLAISWVVKNGCEGLVKVLLKVHRKYLVRKRYCGDASCVSEALVLVGLFLVLRERERGQTVLWTVGL